MIVDPQIIAILAGAGTVISTLAGFVYRELKEQISDRDTRITTLETEAREAVRAKDAEIAEWKRRVLGEKMP